MRYNFPLKMKIDGLKTLIHLALAEDQANKDVTTARLPNVQKASLSFHLIANEPGVFCGTFLAKPVFSTLSSRVKFKKWVQDGSNVKAGQTLGRMTGPAKALLGGERVFLNLASRLSGIATLTRQYADILRPWGAKVYDTRKTTPLIRSLEKRAVQVGGGVNHRFSLGDAILIKDNHLEFLKKAGVSVSSVYSPEALKKKRPKGLKFVELEARTLKEVWQGIQIRADVIMLDNMPLDRVKKAVTLIRAARKGMKTETPFIEASGGVSLGKAKRLAQLGVQRISVGALTHSAPALDLSLEVSHSW